MMPFGFQRWNRDDFEESAEKEAQAAMPIMYTEFLKQKLNRPNPNGGTYWGAFERLVDLYDQSPSDWVTSLEMKQIHRVRQLDKFEPVITYYLFAALAEATQGFSRSELVAGLLSKAFSNELAVELAAEVARYGVANLEYEALIAPNKNLRQAVARQVESYPIAYTRQIAAGRPGVRFESATRLDCFIGDRTALGEDADRAPGKFGLGVEAKFTSDIDDETTYTTHRNQIARIIEVGNQRVERFVILLIAPRAYRLASSRLFVYKMGEYQGQSGVAALRRDLLLPQPDDTLARWIQHMGWLDWEDIVEFLYPESHPRADWQSPHHQRLREFLIDRRIWPY